MTSFSSVAFVVLLLAFCCACASGAPHLMQEADDAGLSASGSRAGDSASASVGAADGATGGDTASLNSRGGGNDGAAGGDTASPNGGGGGNTGDAAEESTSDATSHTGFVHPGLLLLQADLDKIRANVGAGTAPWSTAWAALKNVDAGIGYQASVTQTVTDAYALQNQGHAAWVLAVKWVASGDMAYATAAKRVLDAWVDGVTSMQSTTLRTGIGAVQMANAAEIIAFGFNGEAAWPAAQVTKARTWFKSVVWPRIGMANAQRSSNWGTAAMAGCMATAIFADDPVKFDYTVSAFKNGFTDAPDGCSGVTQYVCEATGQPTEAGRDQGHAQGGVAHLVEVAMMAWNQGTTDLVPYANDRLVTGMEYLAKYNLNNDVPYDPNFPDPCHVYLRWMTISPLLRGMFSPVYEMANKLFTLAGAAHANTTQVIASPGYQPEGTNSDHCGLGTLIMR